MSSWPLFDVQYLVINQGRQMNSLSPTISLAQELVRQPSISPDDAGCQELLGRRLEAAGFTVEQMRFGPVDNFWARRGDVTPVLAFAGHTDVVPTGPLDQWSTDPFSGAIEEGMLKGRGAADMKGGLAAIVTACERFVTLHPQHRGSIALLVTSDEEGAAVEGTCRVIDVLEARGEKIDWCIIGEPTSNQRVADTVKNGRRGSAGGRLTITGKQGHVAYPHLAHNPIHDAASIVNELCNREWDQGNAFFPPTTFQVSNFNSGTGATNVIPGMATVDFNFRHSPESSMESLEEVVRSVCEAHNVNVAIEWEPPGFPFQTLPGTLIDAVTEAVKKISGQEPQLSTDGGTSDGRFIAPTGAQVIELGPLNATIHQINEQVSTDDLDTLSQIYQEVLTTLLA
ncbi:MAG TPA: succinyl-diaminopimelate desuccinylase [Arenicellales bacterium]|jgi:succinyl-diaminopimelate desuccinylase|nr:succinyl-diaminopimelate desuccinylase [Arenicellales bacterium]HJL66536.1 succinyl-diaminopimelate desuccinylase [Arenicellales bacterium]|tara:strand:- start:984 stop:2177 length:1194 start_codon:yes stop_codon:yes gene_type:complete